MAPNHLHVSRRGFLAGTAAAAGVALLPGSPAAGLLGGAGSTTEPFRLAVAWPATAAQRAALAHFDLTHAGRDGGVEVLLWPGDRSRLALTGIRHQVVVDDLVAHDQHVAQAARGGSATVAAQPGQVADYRIPSAYEADMDALVRARPDLARRVVLAERTLEGRRVTGIEIGASVWGRDGRPTFYVDGVHHAREWPSGELAMMFATDLVRSEGTNARVTALLAACRVLVVPIVNADGFAHSRGFPIDDRPLELATAIVGAGSYWRKNRRALSGDLGLGQLGSLTAYGVDPNRNYGIHWGGDGASPIPVEQDYRGPAVFSEAESRNVNRLFLTRGVTGVLTNHTYGDLVLRPWGDTEADAPDEALLRQVGDAMASINGYTSQKGIALYPTTGTTEDHAYAAVGALSYTFEHGLDAFHPPYASFVPEAYARNREAFLVLAEAAADPAHHAVISGRTVTTAGTGTPTDVVVRKTVTVPTSDGVVTDQLVWTVRTGIKGAFTIHLGPSTSPLSTVEEAYEISTPRASVQVSVARGEKAAIGTLLA